jgi:hypothetical protein
VTRSRPSDFRVPRLEHSPIRHSELEVGLVRGAVDKVDIQRTAGTGRAFSVFQTYLQQPVTASQLSPRSPVGFVASSGPVGRRVVA